MTHITTEVDKNPVIRLAYNSGVEDIRLLGGESINNPKVMVVFINGNILGVTICYKRLIQVRQNQTILHVRLLDSSFLDFRYSGSCVAKA